MVGAAFLFLNLAFHYPFSHCNNFAIPPPWRFCVFFLYFGSTCYFCCPLWYQNTPFAWWLRIVKFACTFIPSRSYCAVAAQSLGENNGVTNGEGKGAHSLHNQIWNPKTPQPHRAYQFLNKSVSKMSILKRKYANFWLCLLEDGSRLVLSWVPVRFGRRMYCKNWLQQVWVGGAR